MRRYIITVLLIIILVFQLIDGIFSQTIQNNLSDMDFFNYLISTPNPVILDVQTKKEYKKCHITNAINAPRKDILMKICDTLSKDAEIFVYCSQGERSLTCQTILKENGFSHVYNLKYGIETVLNNPIIKRYKSYICTNP